MQTAWYERNGPAESVLQLGDKPIPALERGEVLVKLATSGVNPSDVKSRAGRPFAFDFVVPHSDGAGIIEAVSENVDKARLGERVWIWNGQWQRQFGTAAEYIAVPENQAVRLDENIDFETAACFGIPGLTAAHAINLLKKIDTETILVTGAAASVGHYITQMAVRDGRKVIATASKEKSQIATDAGAFASIDYKNEDVGTRVLELTDGAGVDVVIDMDFSSTLRLIPSQAIRSYGTIFSYGSNDMGDLSVSFRDLLFKSMSLKFFLVYQLQRDEREKAISTLEDFFLTGAAMTRISHTLPFADIVKAHELVESGTANGNVVLEF
ncbi:MAG: NADPH:quinone reductase [Pseudomonadota bacterium]